MSIKVESTSVKADEPKALAEATEETETTEVATDDVETTDEAVEETAQESDETAEEVAAKSEEKTEEKPKKQGGFKKKIAKYQVELSAKEQEIERLRAELAAKSQTQETAKPELKDKPKIDDFDSQAEFLEALADWKLKQVEVKLKQEQEKEKQKTLQQQKTESYNASLKKAKEELPDYDEVYSDFVEEHGDYQISAELTQLIADSPVGPKVVYELMKNKDEFDRLNSLSMVAAAKEFGKLEDRLTPQKKQEVKTKTNAPAPLKTVAAKTPSVKKDIFNPNLSQTEYEAIRRAQIKASRGA